MKKILGISAYYHDSAAAIIYNNEIIAAAQEERFTRVKHTADFPIESIKFCLQESGFSIDELDAVVFYDKPLLKFERLLETYYAFAPKGLISFIKAIPIWLNEKLFLKRLIHKGLKEIEDYDKKNLKLIFSEHHISHAASAFYPSPFNEAAILTIDGVGEWSTSTICIGRGSAIDVKAEMKFPNSVGLLYSSFTYFLGFRVNSGEYKLMGLAPYGIPESEETKRFIQIIKSNLIDIKEDGSIWMNQKYFNYAIGLKMIKIKKWVRLFSITRRNPEDEILQEHCNLALAIQMITEEILIKMARHAQKITGSKNLCLAGGVALNCVANGKILKEKIFENIFIQPAAGDAGGSLGAALAANYIYFEQGRTCNEHGDSMKASYLGPDFSEKEITLMNKKNKAKATRHDNYRELSEFIVDKISEGKVVGWFQGKMEFGPRALGNRSILADATKSEMQKHLNLKIKSREGFRPFAPAVLVEETSKFFDLEIESPYMLFVTQLKQERRNKLDGKYFELPIWDRLYFNRSDIPSITHVDFSSRVQTVKKETNPRFWNLLKAFKAKTGYGILINTSFNVRGEPIVCNPNDAYKCFMNTEMDYLVIENFVYKKQDQPNWQDSAKWFKEFNED